MQSDESIKAALERFHSGEDLSKDEILDGVIAMYAKEPLTMESFRAMLFDLYSYGALTPDETWLVGRWGGLGIEVAAEEYEANFNGVREKYEEPSFTIPDLIDHFMKMLDERRNATAVSKQELYIQPLNDEEDKYNSVDSSLEALRRRDKSLFELRELFQESRSMKEVGGVYESTSDNFFTNLQAEYTNLVQ
jgi:hypothetical protein